MKTELDSKKIWVAGHQGMLGSAICKELANYDCKLIAISKNELDLRTQKDTREWIGDNKPEIVFLTAGKVGGIKANTKHPTDFIYDNLAISINVTSALAEIGTEKLLFIGSSCIYPRASQQPIKEDSLLTGPLEKTNEAYAIAKIAGIKLCEAYKQEKGLNFISAMPTNLYGPNDNFNLETSHVIPGLMHKFHLAKINKQKTIRLWGTGQARREFLHVNDCASALVHVMQFYNDSCPINIGSGKDLPIRELAETIANIVGWSGEINFDQSELLDGTPRKLLDISKLSELDWQSKISLEDGLRETYQWFLENKSLESQSLNPIH
jgi:GDP-L-fucose synthase